MVSQSIHMISFFLFLQQCVKWYCYEYDVTGDEGGRHGGGEASRCCRHREICCGENMFIHYRTLLLGGEGNISCTSFRCCHVGVKRS